MGGRAWPGGALAASMEVVAELRERDLIARCREGDPEACRTLYERHAPEVLRFLSRLLDDHEAALDALQEAFVRAFGALPGFDLERPLRPWLLAIARNAALAGLRRRARRDALVGRAGAPDPAPSAREGAARRETRALVQDALRALTDEHREVVLLRLAHGLSLAEVAGALEVTERTVRNRLRAAAVLLERELRRRGLDPRGGA